MEHSFPFSENWNKLDLGAERYLYLSVTHSCHHNRVCILWFKILLCNNKRLSSIESSKMVPAFSRASGPLTKWPHRAHLSITVDQTRPGSWFVSFLSMDRASPPQLQVPRSDMTWVGEWYVLCVRTQEAPNYKAHSSPDDWAKTLGCPPGVSKERPNTDLPNSHVLPPKWYLNSVPTDQSAQKYLTCPNVSPCPRASVAEPADNPSQNRQPTR